MILKRAIKFYEGVFDWEIEKWEHGDYWLVSTMLSRQEPGINGAIIPKKFGDMAGVQLVFIQSTNLRRLKVRVVKC